MSYNISSWHTKRLEQLSIPLEALTVLSQELIDRRWESPLPAAIRVDGEELAVCCTVATVYRKHRKLVPEDVA